MPHIDAESRCRVLNQGPWASLPHVPSLTLVHASQQAPGHPWPSFSWRIPSQMDPALLLAMRLLYSTSVSSALLVCSAVSWIYFYKLPWGQDQTS